MGGLEYEVYSRDWYGVGAIPKPLYGKRRGMVKYTSLKDYFGGWGAIQEKLYEELWSP